MEWEKKMQKGKNLGITKSNYANTLCSNSNLHSLLQTINDMVVWFFELEHELVRTYGRYCTTFAQWRKCLTPFWQSKKRKDKHPTVFIWTKQPMNEMCCWTNFSPLVGVLSNLCHSFQANNILFEMFPHVDRYGFSKEVVECPGILDSFLIYDAMSWLYGSLFL